MTTLNITLPEPLRTFVEAQVAEGHYPTPDEYIQQLILEDSRRKTREKVDALLIEGLNSGEPLPVSAAFWEQKDQQLTERYGNAAEE